MTSEDVSVIFDLRVWLFLLLPTHQTPKHICKLSRLGGLNVDWTGLNDGTQTPGNVLVGCVIH